MRILSLILFVSLSIQSFAVNPKDTIDPTAYRPIVLEKALYDLVNAYRAEHKVNKLIFNQIIHKAAKNHSDYLLDKETLTHEQDNLKGKTVQDRIKKYLKTTRIISGENIARIQVLKPTLNYTSDGKKEKAVNMTYEQAAQAIFNAWKQSSVHKKNMLNEKYSITAISGGFNATDQTVTAVQVFAHVG
jgi:uncharacterized protein YkwD